MNRRTRLVGIRAAASVLVVLLSSLVAPTTGQADSAWSNPTSLSADPSTEATNPRIIASQDGLKLAVVWVRRTGPASGVVQVSRSTNGGATWTAPETVTATPANVENPRIMGSTDLRRIRVFWVQRGAATGTILTSVSVDGAPWPSPTTVTSGLVLGDSAAYAVSGAPDAQAGHVVWTEDVVGTGYDVIKWRFFNTNGWAPSESISPTPGIASRPTLVTTNGGNDVTVAWNHVNAPKARTAQLVKRTSAGWSPVQTVSPANTNTAFEVALDMPSGTTGAAIWSQFNSSGDRAPFVSVNTGGSWSTGTSIGSQNSYDHRVAVSADGLRIVAVWGTSAGLVARVRSNGAWQPQVALPGPSGDQVQLAASTTAKQLIAVWRSNATQALAAATSADGGATWTSLPSPAGPVVTTAQIGMHGDGKRFAVVWSGQTGSSWFTRAAAGPDLLPRIAVSPASVDFGRVAVGDAGEATVTVTNTGLAPLTVLGAAVSSPDFVRTAGCGLALLPAASCSIPLLFLPKSAGVTSGSLTITHTAGSPLTLPMSGDAYAAADPTPTLTPTPPPAPTPEVRQAQVPRDAKGIPPKRIRAQGRTLLVGRNALTNANQQIVTTVKVKAPKARYRIIKGRQGKLKIRTFGKPLKRVTLIQRAPQTASHLPYERKTVYRKGKR